MGYQPIPKHSMPKRAIMTYIAPSAHYLELKHNIKLRAVHNHKILHRRFLYKVVKLSEMLKLQRAEIQGFKYGEALSLLS